MQGAHLQATQSQATHAKATHSQATHSQVTHSQDQSVQAMTEVALALSMAFFSLLLLALVSISVPSTAGAVNKDATESLRTERTAELLLSESRVESTSMTNNEVPLEMQYVFYFDSKFYNQDLQQTDISKFNNSQKLILAMPMDTDVTQALALQQSLNGFDLSLTIMDSDWLAALESHAANN